MAVVISGILVFDGPRLQRPSPSIDPSEHPSSSCLLGAGPGVYEVHREALESRPWYLPKIGGWICRPRGAWMDLDRSREPGETSGIASRRRSRGSERQELPAHRWYAWGRMGPAPRHARVFPRKVPGVASLVGTLAFIGLGAAIIDQVQGIEAAQGLSAASSPLYYLGWVLTLTGVALLFLTVDTVHFHPAWLFALSVLVEVYGWWNVWWSLIDLYVCGGCHAPNGGVDLANLGPLGQVVVPLEVFELTTVAAILGPLVIALLAPHDVDNCPPGGSILFPTWDRRTQRGR